MKSSIQEKAKAGLKLSLSKDETLPTSTTNEAIRSPTNLRRTFLISLATFLLLLLSTVFPLPLPISSILNRISLHPPTSTPSASPFNWTLCPIQPNRSQSPNSSFQCGTFKVPLDYTNSSDQRSITLVLTLFQSGNQKSNTTILLNPGGPGGSGTQYAFRKSESLNQLLGGGIDILGFDPRGELCFQIFQKLLH